MRFNLLIAFRAQLRKRAEGKGRNLAKADKGRGPRRQSALFLSRVTRRRLGFLLPFLRSKEQKLIAEIAEIQISATSSRKKMLHFFFQTLLCDFLDKTWSCGDIWAECHRLEEVRHMKDQHVVSW